MDSPEEPRAHLQHRSPLHTQGPRPPVLCHGLILQIYIYRWTARPPVQNWLLDFPLSFLFLSFFSPKATRMWGDVFSSSLPRERYRCLIFPLSLGQLRPSDQGYKQRETAPTHKEWVYFILFCCIRPGWQKASLNMYWASNRKQKPQKGLRRIKKIPPFFPEASVPVVFNLPNTAAL